MSAVFAVQSQLRIGRNGELESKFDLASASEYGELRYVLSSNAAPWSDGILSDIEREMADYVSGRDYILLIGNPILIALVAVVAARSGPIIQFLQWNGRQCKYLPVTINLLGDLAFQKEPC